MIEPVTTEWGGPDGKLRRLCDMTENQLRKAYGLTLQSFRDHKLTSLRRSLQALKGDFERELRRRDLPLRKKDLTKT